MSFKMGVELFRNTANRNHSTARDNNPTKLEESTCSSSFGSLSPNLLFFFKHGYPLFKKMADSIGWKIRNKYWEYACFVFCNRFQVQRGCFDSGIELKYLLLAFFPNLIAKLYLKDIRAMSYLVILGKVTSYFF